MPKQKVLSGRSEPVYRYIVEQVLSGKLQQGQRIDEMKIAEVCGTSRTPVHQALKQLEINGIVYIVPNKGIEVVKLSPDDKRSIGEARVLFGWLAAKLAMHNGSEVEFLRLQKLAEECAAELASEDLGVRIKGDAKFYIEMAALGKNNLILSFLRKLLLQVGLIQTEIYRDRALCIAQTQSHLDIVNALLSRDISRVRDQVLPRQIRMFDIDEDYMQTIMAPD